MSEENRTPKRGSHYNDAFDVDPEDSPNPYKDQLLKSWDKKVKKDDQAEKKDEPRGSKRLKNLVSDINKSRINRGTFKKIDIKKISRSRNVRVGAVSILFLISGLLVFSAVSEDRGLSVDTELLANQGFGEVLSGKGASDNKSAGIGELEEGVDVIDEKQGVITFKDEIDGKEIIITKQPLPDEFLADVGEAVENLSLSLSNKTAINRFETDFGLIYVAIMEDGTQASIFSTKGILYFVTAELNISADSWIQFANSV